MNLLDLAAIAILAAAVALGAWAGFFPQLLGLLGAAAGFGVALIATNALHPTIAAIDQPMRALVAASGKLRAALGWKPRYEDLRTIVRHAWDFARKRNA